MTRSELVEQLSVKKNISIVVADRACTIVCVNAEIR